jgi:antitoxin MazE
MTVNLIKIGNSKGIRIPKPLIDECGLGDTVELRVEKGKLVILPEAVRNGWESKFARVSSDSPESLLLGDAITNDFDREEWEW